MIESDRNSYLYSVPYFYPESEGEENQGETWTYNDGDALPDHVFKEAEFFSQFSPFNMKRNEDPDKVENVTLDIFKRLYEVVDQIPRTEIDIAVTSHFSPSCSPKLENSKFIQSNSLRPYVRDTNFYEESQLEQPLRIQNVVNDILSSSAYLFFGWDPLSQRSAETPQEMKKNLDSDRLFWGHLRSHYSEYFQIKMDTTFLKADQLIQSRIEDKRWAFIQRLTLYATLIIALIGKVKGNQAVLIVGLSASAITLLFMITHYGTTSFKQSQRGADLRQSIVLAENLKASIDDAYGIAARHRLDDLLSEQ